MVTRRIFLKQSSLAAISLGIAPFFLTRTVRALEQMGKRNKTLVLILQRGAMDGLSLLPPIGDSHYLDLRPNIGIKPLGESPPLMLDGYFGLHPAMIPLKPLWDNGTLAFVHQSGSPSNSRSHFDEQDFFEAGIPGDKNTSDGFLNRALQIISPPSSVGIQTPLRGVAIQPNMPRILQGSFPAISMNSIQDFSIKPTSSDSTASGGFEAMYQQATDQVFRGVGKEVFESIKTVQSVASGTNKSNENLYPKNAIGKRLQEIAALIKARLGLQIAVTDTSGWDTHVNQGNVKGQLSDRFKELAESLAAFAKDLGPQFEDVCLVTATEFGRTVKENGTRGTDHGHGSVMMILGGAIKGRRIYGKWKELSQGNLFEGRDLPVNTDSRDVLGEVLHRHLEIERLEPIFPHFENNPKNRVGLFRG